jgi:hypothetical protein
VEAHGIRDECLAVPEHFGHRQQFRAYEKTFLKPAFVVPIGARERRSLERNKFVERVCIV